MFFFGLNCANNINLDDDDDDNGLICSFNEGGNHHHISCILSDKVIKKDLIDDLTHHFIRVEELNKKNSNFFDELTQQQLLQQQNKKKKLLKKSETPNLLKRSNSLTNINKIEGNHIQNKSITSNSKSKSCTDLLSLAKKEADKEKEEENEDEVDDKENDGFSSLYEKQANQYVDHMLTSTGYAKDNELLSDMIMNMKLKEETTIDLADKLNTVSIVYFSPLT
eukprot:Pgem_evm1s7710